MILGRLAVFVVVLEVVIASGRMALTTMPTMAATARLGEVQRELADMEG